jgi:hypothetical protein
VEGVVPCGFPPQLLTRLDPAVPFFVRLAVLLGGNDRTSYRPNGRFPPGLD